MTGKYVTKNECDQCRQNMASQRHIICQKIDSLRKEIIVGLATSTTVLTIVISVLNLILR